MAGAFAKSSFNTGPNDDYRTVDVYKQEGKGVISSYTERRMAGPATGLGSLFGGKSIIGLDFTATEALKNAKTAWGLAGSIDNAKSVADKLSRVSGGMSFLGPLLNKASPGLAKTLTDQIGGGQNIFATVAGTIQRVKSGNLPDLRAVTGLLNKATGTDLFDISDKDSLLGSAAGMVTAASRGGIPKSFSELTKKFINDPTDIAKLIDKTLPSILQSSDLGTLKEMADVNPSAILLTNPTILQDFSFNYELPDGTTQEAKLEVYSEMRETYATIQEDWLSCNRIVTNAAGEPIESKSIDLSKIANASPAFKDVMKAGAMASDKIEDKLLLIETNPLPYLKDLAKGVVTKAPSVREQLSTAFPEVSLSKGASQEPKVQTVEELVDQPHVEGYEEPNNTYGVNVYVVKRTWPDKSYSEERTTKYMGKLQEKSLIVYDRKGEEISKRIEDFTGIIIR